MPDIKCVVLSRIRQGDVRGTNSEAVLNSTRTDSPAHIFTAIIQRNSVYGSGKRDKIFIVLLIIIKLPIDNSKEARLEI